MEIVDSPYNNLYGLAVYPRPNSPKRGNIMDFKDKDISPELREKAMACQTPEELLALAKKEGYKLSEEELASVSGGGWSCTHCALLID